jgi:hypothetical protein
MRVASTGGRAFETRSPILSPELMRLCSLPFMVQHYSIFSYHAAMKGNA